MLPAITESLLKRIPVFEGYPSKHEKKPKKELKYSHKHEIVEITHPVTKIVMKHFIGKTYRKEK